MRAETPLHNLQSKLKTKTNQKINPSQTHNRIKSNFKIKFDFFKPSEHLQNFLHNDRGAVCSLNRYYIHGYPNHTKT